MPALRVAINGKPIATVSTDGYNIMSVRIGGTLIDEAPATLDMMGTIYSEDSESTHLTWVSDQPLQAGQQVTVSMLEHAETSHQGMTLEELYPDIPSAEPPAETEPLSKAEILERVRNTPRIRERIGFRVGAPSGAAVAGHTRDQDHGFNFTILWDSWSPDYARVWLNTFPLDSIESRSDTHGLMRERMVAGQSVVFALDEQ